MAKNSAAEEKAGQARRPAAVLDGIARHSPEGMSFKARAGEVDWKQAMRERDAGAFDWTRDAPGG